MVAPLGYGVGYGVVSLLHCRGFLPRSGPPVPGGADHGEAA